MRWEWHWQGLSDPQVSMGQGVFPTWHHHKYLQSMQEPPNARIPEARVHQGRFILMLRWYIYLCVVWFPFNQEIGFTHMRIVEGIDSLLQLAGLLARLCLKTQPQEWIASQHCHINFIMTFLLSMYVSIYVNVQVIRGWYLSHCLYQRWDIWVIHKVWWEGRLLLILCVGISITRGIAINVASSHIVSHNVCQLGTFWAQTWVNF